MDLAPAETARRAARSRAALAALAAVVLCACAPAGTADRADEGRLRATTSPGTATAPATPAPRLPAAPTSAPATTPSPAGAPDRARPAVDVPVRPLEQRLVPDVLVLGAVPGAARARLLALSSPGRAVGFRAGPVAVAGRDVPAVAVDASSFRAFTAAGTAEADAVWQAVARGEAVVSHEAASSGGLVLGQDVTLTGPAGVATLRLGALATTGFPRSDLVVDDEVGQRLGLVADTGLLLTAPDGQDAEALAEDVRQVTGTAADVELLTAPAADPVASLTGGEAAQDLGAFSYRYFADGTIEPDPGWVEANIRTETVPVLGPVTCHRLMLPQLRGALQEVADAGLSSLLTTYDGCYVPRFIERDPTRSISLHTWGIAIDLDAATNYRGIRGTMDDRIVEIFKRWGFRWGGDWAYTDPMHFELGTLLDRPSD